MTNAARLELYAFRNDPFCVTMEIIGEDLSDATFAFAVKLYADQTGSALLGPLGMTTTEGAEGIRIVDVLTVEGVPYTLLEIIATKAHVQALPAADEAGDDVTLYYDLQWTPDDADESGFAPVEATRLYGPFILRGSANV
jgi:hypothetical protein